MKDILILVDVQKGFTTKGYSADVIRKISKLLELEVFDVVIASKYCNIRNGTINRVLSYEGMLSLSDREIPSQLVRNIDLVVEKNTYSIVTPSLLQGLCALNNGKYPERVYLAGLDTDCCVLASAISLFDMNIVPTILADYCGSLGGLDSHSAGLKCLERIVGSSNILHKDILSKADLIQ